MIATQKTQTVQFFLDRFNAATVDGAVERAANSLHRDILGGFHDYVGIPVDVERIAETVGIRLADQHLADLGAVAACPPHEEARLIPVAEGFVVVRRDRSNHTRKRWSLAHEIGHSLFYRRDGKRPTHAIGLLDNNELAAEERICNSFAQALLMPQRILRGHLGAPSEDSIWSMLDLIERTAQRFDVSIPALLSRMNVLRLRWPECLILHFRFTENTRTALDPRLRVRAGWGFGNTRDTYVWKNRSVEGVNLKCVARLFDAWRNVRQDNVEHRTWGRYVLDVGTGMAIASRDVRAESMEQVNVSFRRGGRWSSSVATMRVASCLYATRPGTERDAHIVAVLKPSQ